VKAVVYSAHGSTDVLEYTDVADPVPGPADVILRVEAIMG